MNAPVNPEDMLAAMMRADAAAIRKRQKAPVQRVTVPLKVPKSATRSEYVPPRPLPKVRMKAAPRLEDLPAPVASAAPQPSSPVAQANIQRGQRTRDAIEPMYRAGMTAQAIAEEIGLAVRHVRWHIRALIRADREAGRVPMVLSWRHMTTDEKARHQEALCEKIRALVAEGKDKHQIAEAIGLGEARTYRLMKIAAPDAIMTRHEAAKKAAQRARPGAIRAAEGRRARVAELIRQHLTLQEIGVITDFGEATVRNHIRVAREKGLIEQADIEACYAKAREARFAGMGQRREEVRLLMEANQSAEAIASALGVSKGTAHYVMKQVRQSGWVHPNPVRVRERRMTLTDRLAAVLDAVQAVLTEDPERTPAMMALIDVARAEGRA